MDSQLNATPSESDTLTAIFGSFGPTSTYMNLVNNNLPCYSFYHIKHLFAHDCRMVLMYHVPVHLPYVPTLLARKDIAHIRFLQYDIASVFLVFQKFAD